MPRDLVQLAERLSRHAAAPINARLANQAHSRRLMLELGSSPENWPNFTARLDERLHFGASFLIEGGLSLLDAPDHRDLARSSLFAGAEALEHLTASEGTYGASLSDEKLRCAAAYYLSGHQARAYVILDRRMGTGEELGKIESLVSALLKQDASATYQAVQGVFADSAYSDDGLAVLVAEGGASLDDAIGNVATRTLANALALYLEHLRTGGDEPLRRSREAVSALVEFALESRFVDVWWWAKVVAKLLDEFNATSLWSNVPKILPPGGDDGVLRRYIQAALRRGISTLWPSQLTAIDRIAEPHRGSFCVRMPTSAGKTRIAELSILTALLDHPSDMTKCVYLVPFRSLAVEVERSLRAAFGPLGYGVSELYGGYEVSPAEIELARELSILVLTPEKLDSMLRFAPELFADVRCVVVDEGHMAGDTSERGLRAEFVLNRLLRKLPRDRCRYVFASAVLPNAEDFATWIGGDAGALVDSSWRPSRQMVGELQWRSGQARIEYTHVGHRAFGTPCFVPRFIASYTWKEGRKTKSFPANGREAVALSAVRLAAQGPVLLFVPQRQHIESTAGDVLAALECQGKMDPERDSGHMSIDIDKPPVADAISTLASELGEDSTVVRCARRGIAVHHGRLPGAVRTAMERFIATGSARVIVATTTLAAGVNLPIRSVLVKGLWKGAGDRIDALTFWNICGRAGRGMREVEGQVLFFIDLDKQPYKVARDREYHRKLVETPNSEAILSRLYRLLRDVQSVWLSRQMNADFAALCLRLSENDQSWAGKDAQKVAEWLTLLDDQLFALHTEQLEDGELADLLQEVLSDSLLQVQLASAPIKGLTIERAGEFFAARMRYVRSRVPDRAKRDTFYKIALSLDDCLALEASEAQVRALLGRFRDWPELNATARNAWIDDFVAWAATLPFTEIPVAQVAAHSALAQGWLAGSTFRELAEVEQVGLVWPKLDDVTGRVESVCGFKLAWAANAAVVYATSVASEAGVPAEVCKALPAMFRYGTLEPVATQFAPMLGNDLRLAEDMARVCPHPFGSREGFAWIRSATEDGLTGLGLHPEVASRAVQTRLAVAGNTGTETGRREIRLDGARLKRRLEQEELVFAVPRGADEATVELFGMDGLSLGALNDPEVLIATAHSDGGQWVARQDPEADTLVLWR